MPDNNLAQMVRKIDAVLTVLLKPNGSFSRIIGIIGLTAVRIQRMGYWEYQKDSERHGQ
jgi:hypothetical protein